MYDGTDKVPTFNWTDVSVALVGLTGSYTLSGYNCTLLLTEFSSLTTTVGYINVTASYGGVPVMISISVARVFNPVPVIKGDYSSGTVYTGNCIQRDAVKYTDGDWYALRPTIGDSSTGWVASEWERLNSYKNVATDTLLAQYANIAGFIYKDGVMISQTGTIAGDPSTNYSHPDFVPNIELDGLTGQAVIRGDLYAAGNQFKALSDGTFEVEFSTNIDRYSSSGSTETVLQTVSIKNTTGEISIATSDYDAAKITSQGVFANKAGIQAIPSSAGVELKASIVGLGQGDLASAAYGGLGAICGVYGDSYNENDSPAPSYGGYFRKLRASGLYLSVIAITSSYVCSDYVVVVSCYNTSGITVSLPPSPYPGKVIEVRRNNASSVSVSGNGEQIMLPDGSLAPSTLIGTRGDMYRLIFDGSYWLMNAM
jgi:hypothetical protein